MKKEELRSILKLDKSIDVISVEEETNRIMISIKSNKKRTRCPRCNKFSNKIHDYLKPSRVDYFSIIGLNTYLIAYKRRFECAKCNKSFTEDLGLTNRNENVSLKIKQKILLDCMNRDKTIKQIADDNNVSEYLVRITFLEAMKNYPKHISNLPEIISFDEVSTYTGEGVYSFILNDPIHRYTLDILKTRNKDYLVEYFMKVNNDLERIALSKYAKGMEFNNQQDYIKALPYIRTSAELGYAPAQNTLGAYYAEGYGVPQNVNIAIEWYLKAAKQNDDTSQYNLAHLYYEGKLVEQNYSEAFKWYRKAAELGDAESQCKVGYFYRKGLGTEVNYTEAVYWYTKAATQGDPIAQSNLANCYMRGEGVEVNLVKTYEWYKKSAESGYAYAQAMLGLCYNEGVGVNQNFEEAFKWFLLAAEQNEADAILNLGIYYDNGIYVKQDLRKAFDLYLKASQLNNPYGLMNVGICYANGRGVETDFAKAFIYFEKSANLGLDLAQLNLAICYENGYGTEKNIVKAKYWYSKAAKQGNETAKQALSRLS